MAYHPALLRSIKDFNSGRYFEAHEHLEDALDEVEDDDNTWQLFIGLIRIAVGYHKYSSGYPGGERMLGMGLETVASLPEVCNGVQLKVLRQRVQEDLGQLDGLSERLQTQPPRVMLIPRKTIRRSSLS